MWDNYSQLYVPVSSDDEVVMKVFSSNQMEGVVSLSNQYLPYSPSVSLKSKLLTSQGDGRSAMSMAALSSSLLADILKDNNYLSLRNLFFFDESKDFRIYYIPENQKKNIPYCISELKNYGINAAYDAKSAYPWFLPLIITFIVVFFAWLARNRVVFLISAFPFLFFVYCMPLYPVTISVSIGILYAFCASNLWKRNGALFSLISNYFLTAMALIAFVAAFACGLQPGFFFLMVCASSCSAVYLFYIVEADYYAYKNSFTFVMIRPARMISIFAEKSRIVILSMITAQFFVIMLFFLVSYTSTGNSSGIGKKKVMLPAAGKNIEFSADRTDRNDGCNLPGLEDYYKWTWMVASYPYISLNSDYYSGKSAYPMEVVFPEYEEIDGKIIKNDSVIRFDDSFRYAVNNSIDNLSFNAIEKVLQSQQSNGDFRPVYSSSESVRISFFCIIIMVFSILMLLFIYFSVIMKSSKSGGKK